MIAACGGPDRVAFTTTPIATASPSTVAPPSTTTTTTDASSSSTGPTTSGSADTTTTLLQVGGADAPRVKWNGGTAYIHGANLPWLNFGCDFGCGRDKGGASSDASRIELAKALGTARDAGMNVVRWWLFPGDVTVDQITRDDQGLPLGINPLVFTDIDAALSIAGQFGISYTFTLFSEPTAIPEAWVTTEEGRTRLANVLGELFSRYNGDSRIMTWDVINEPEFDLWAGQVTEEDLRALIMAIVQSIHDHSSAPATVGGARLDGLPFMIGLGLDYYTVHWYDNMTKPDECLACVTYAEVRDALDLDKPIVVGEMYAGPETTGRFELFYDHGYAGTLAWSLEPERTQDRLVVDLAQATTFSQELAAS